MSLLKDYLGDGVYIDVAPHGGLVMTTENGVEATNTIYLEPAVLAALDRYRERIKHIDTNTPPKET